MKNSILNMMAAAALLLPLTASGAEKQKMEIVSDNLKLTLMVGEDGRLYELGFGDASAVVPIPEKELPREQEFVPAYGNGVITEPAIQATHTDGNTSTDLQYVGYRTDTVAPGLTHTVISLKDPAYNFFVDINVKCYENSGMMEIWNDIRHDERGGKVTLYRYASASPLLNSDQYWLTQFNGRYKREATLEEERLGQGMKVLDSKLGIRATQYRIPSFILAYGHPANEREGEVFAGSLRWSGSYQLAFDKDWNNRLRVLSGINPLGSHINLERGEEFATPAMLYVYSKNGKGDASRRFHRWANEYAVRDADRPRPVILNNWEATHCDFDEERLVGLFDGAKEVGAELFLLDDGWFGNGEYSRDDDKHGLGDWEISAKKLPRGLSYLAKEAAKRNVGFGIWLEPEMVSPKSALYEKHPEWIITQQKREPILGRHQEILDLTRPEVQQFEWGVIDNTLGPNPGVSYVKWDCNRYVTQPGSGYLPAQDQSHLLVDYNKALYRLMDRFATAYPDVTAMLCAGGGGRADYGAMPYFHSFWPSDNTDPLGRIKIQWGFGHFFPGSTMAAHVTRMGKRHLKLAIDVALSGTFGIDLALDKATPEERRQLAQGVKLYKDEIRDLVMHGELYRLVSPYENPMASMSYISKDKKEGVVYIYQTEDGSVPQVRLDGLDPMRRYTVKEVGLPDKMLPRFMTATYTGQELMEKGLENPLCSQFDSAVLRVSAL